MLHPAANRHPKATHQWLLMGVQACRLPALKPLKPSKPLKTLKPLKRLLGMLHPAANSHPKATHQWLLMGRLNNPLACFILQPTATPRPQSMASYGPLKQSLGMLHPAANRHPKATHQWFLMGVQACRLAALKRLKPSKPLKTLKPLKRLLGMLHPAANSHPKATHQWLLMGRLNNPLACFILQPTGTPRPHINSLRRPRLPFASIYTIQTIPQSQINSFFSAFQLAVYYLSLSQRRPWQKTASHRPFDGLLALSSRHWPHSLCKRGKCKHTLSPSQRRPSQKTGSHRPFDGLFALSWRHWPHSLCKRGKCKHTLFPAQRRPLQKTGSHRPFDGLFSLSWRHWPHSLCKRGKCKHTLFPAQCRPWQKTASHRPFDGLFALSWRH